MIWAYNTSRGFEKCPMLEGVIRVMWQRIKDWFSNFMSGRYGMDDLNRFLLILFWIFFVLEVILSGIAGVIFNWLTLIDLVLLYFRMLSRNHYARSEENEKYLSIKERITGGRGGSGRSSSQGRTQQDADHKIFKCPECGQKVRVPRGRGRVQIRCPKCGRQFVKRT